MTKGDWILKLAEKKSWNRYREVNNRKYKIINRIKGCEKYGRNRICKGRKVLKTLY